MTGILSLPLISVLSSNEECDLLIMEGLEDTILNSWFLKRSQTPFAFVLELINSIESERDRSHLLLGGKTSQPVGQAQPKGLQPLGGQPHLYSSRQRTKSEMGTGNMPGHWTPAPRWTAGSGCKSMLWKEPLSTVGSSFSLLLLTCHSHQCPLPWRIR